MEGLQQWAAAVCTTAVVCTLLRHLFPQSALGRQGQLLLPCLFLCVLLSPLGGGVNSVKLPDFTLEKPVDSGVLTARMRQQIAAQVNTTLTQMVNQALSGYGWEAKKVVADMDICEDGSIDMGQITVYVDEVTARRATAVGQVAAKRLGTAVEVAVWEEPR